MLWKIARVIGVVGLVAFSAGHAYKAWWRPLTPAEQALAARGPSSPAELIGRRFVSWRVDRGGDAELVLLGPTASSFGFAPVDLAVRDLKALGQWIARDPERLPARDVILVYEAVLLDRFGADITKPVLVMRWARDDWERVNWSGVTAEVLFALGRPQLVHPVLHEGLAQWCGEGGAFRRGAVLCRQS